MSKVKTFKPMKAVSEKLSFEDIQYPAFLSIKIDGVYSVNLEGQCLGRSLKPFANKWLTKKLSKPEFRGLCGEVVNAQIFNPDEGLELNRQDLCRNTTSYTSSIAKEFFPFAVVLFDYISDGSEQYCYNTDYMSRMMSLYNLLDMKQGRDTIHICGLPYLYKEFMGVEFIAPELILVESAAEAEKYYNRVVEAGHEGVVVRSPEGIFKFGRSTKKSQEIVRFKPEGNSEILVTHFEEAMENQNEAKKNELGYTERSSHKENKVPLGMVGAMVGIDVNSGDVVRIGAGTMKHAERKKVWENQSEYLGKLSQYKFMDTGIKDAPRHPRHFMWRDSTDLDIEPHIMEIYHKAIADKDD